MKFKLQELTAQNRHEQPSRFHVRSYPTTTYAFRLALISFVALATGCAIDLAPPGMRSYNPETISRFVFNLQGQDSITLVSSVGAGHVGDYMDMHVQKHNPNWGGQDFPVTSQRQQITCENGQVSFSIPTKGLRESGQFGEMHVFFLIYSSSTGKQVGSGDNYTVTFRP